MIKEKLDPALNEWPDPLCIEGELTVWTYVQWRYFIAEELLTTANQIAASSRDADDFAYRLAVVAIYKGGHGDGEMAYGLLNISDLVRWWLEKEAENA